jgi:hypothetical protein
MKNTRHSYHSTEMLAKINTPADNQQLKSLLVK